MNTEFKLILPNLVVLKKKMELSNGKKSKTYRIKRYNKRKYSILLKKGY